jgi:hypothetical protein
MDPHANCTTLETLCPACLAGYEADMLALAAEQGDPHANCTSPDTCCPLCQMGYHAIVQRDKGAA